MGLAPELQAQQGQSEGLLGRICWFSIPSATCLDPDTVGKRMVDDGFNRRVPRPAADSDVFRRVTVDAERKKVPVDNTVGQFENWSFREISSASDREICRRLVCETVDVKGRRLNYEQVVDLVFTYPDEKTNTPSNIAHKWQPGFTGVTSPKLAVPILDDVRSEFRKWRGKLHDEKIRHWIKMTLQDMHAVNIRTNGGIYFLREDHAGQVLTLEKFIDDMLPTGGEFWSVEIPDTSRQREMVQQAIEDETHGELSRLIAEVTDLRGQGGFTKERKKAIQDRMLAVIAKIDDYETLLNADLHRLDSERQLLSLVADTPILSRGKKR